MTIFFAIGSGGCLSTDDPNRNLSFRRDIEPVLAKHCFRCHGEKEQESRLDLRSLESILAGGDSGPAVIAGAPEDSLMLEFVSDKKMPPKGRKLSATEIARLRQWIIEGTKP